MLSEVRLLLFWERPFGLGYTADSFQVVVDKFAGTRTFAGALLARRRELTWRTYRPSLVCKRHYTRLAISRAMISKRAQLPVATTAEPVLGRRQVRMERSCQ